MQAVEIAERQDRRSPGRARIVGIVNYVHVAASMVNCNPS
jgi:hypothetical protein